MSKHRPNVWVIRDGAKYSVKEKGKRYAVVRNVSQRVAIRIARLIAQASRSEFFVQSENGRIRARDSHGLDLFPPRG